MLGAAGTKLDLSKLTDEEAKHVWDVIQRDFDLRKKEEDRLGELKSKIQKEDTKIELLGTQSSLTDSYCIRCLQPFKFLVNAKRQCLDCRFHVCRSCSHYSRKEHGWVCDPCHMARVLRIGTLEWYHENVRARFKRFGSAKVMRSLFKRLSGEHSCSQSDLGDGYEEHGLEASDSQQFKDMKKIKRRLTVDPFDFILCCERSNASRRHKDQATGVYDFMDAGERGSEFTQACMAVVFHQIQEQQRGQDQDMVPHHDDLVFVENHAVPSRSVSRLIYSSCGSGNAGGPRGGSSFLPDLDDSEGEEDPCERYPVYHSHPEPCSHASQESLDSAPQISDLNRRMFAVETFLNRLEQKVVPPNFGSLTPQSISPPPPAPPQWEEVENEEQLLRQKLHELTDNISDQSSDEDGFSRPDPSQEVPTRRSPQMKPKPSRIPTRPTSSASTRSSREEEELSGSQKTDLSIESLERKERPLQEASMGSFRGSTALLVELEDQVAQAAADVQNAQSQVSYIENRIAALKAASIPSEKRQKSAIPIQARRLSHNFPTNSFVRSSVYRGSLTQRNPVAKPKPQPPCAKPLMTPGS
ncbi:transcript variant X3 [Nothobranchius furzeri]|uniref:Transcript variant X3 n=1 Tax=Nothobranchius furzeri TaxID=105023 RepID=A0A9D3BNS6_NOTFU|nr:transcript variant X3 [Nothobranchius furzeri]